MIAFFYWQRLSGEVWLQLNPARYELLMSDRGAMTLTLTAFLECQARAFQKDERLMAA